MTADTIDIETVLQKLGKYGIWQIGIYVLWAFAFNFPYVFHALALVFIGSTPPNYHCNVESNLSIPHYGQQDQEKCFMYRNYTIDNSTVSCQNGWVYPNNDQGSTIVTEFELICDKGILAELTQTMYVLGETVGAILITPLADVFGRKKVHLVSQLGLAASTVALAFSVNYVMFILLRIVSGMFLSGVVLTAIVAAIEMFPMEMRTFAGQLFFVWWAGAMMVMDLIAYFLRDWRNLQLALALIPFASMTGYWLCPESVPWLLANGRVNEAEKIIKHAAKINKIQDMPEHPFKQDGVLAKGEPEKSKENEKTKVADNCKAPSGELRNCLTLLSHPLLRKIFLIMMALWFVNNMIYYGITFMSPSMTKNRYLNFFLSALAELPACATCLATLERFGRRKPLCAFHMLASTAMVLLIFIPSETANGTSLLWLVMSLNFIGKFAITGSFNALIQFTMEVYPTNQRNTGLGLSSMAGRVSGMVAPFAIPMARYIPWVPYLTFAVLSFIVGIMALFLPETLYYPLPQTVQEMEEWENPTFSSLSQSFVAFFKKTGKNNNKVRERGDVEEQLPMRKSSKEKNVAV